MIVVLTGGTGGAKLDRRASPRDVDPAELTIICNTGDDCDFSRPVYFAGHRHDHLHAGRLERYGKRLGHQGRHVRCCWSSCAGLGNDAWFNLGDKDLATHITRTRLLE